MDSKRTNQRIKEIFIQSEAVMKKEVSHNSFNPFLQRQIQEQKNKGLVLKKTVKVEVKNEISNKNDK